MSNVVRFSIVAEQPAPAQFDARTENLFATIKTLIRELPRTAQEHLLIEITEMIRPIPAPRAGEVLGTIVHLLGDRSDWTVQELKQEIVKRGVEASAKEIYNALGYLTRKGKIQRIGHGRYLIGGIQVCTSDDLGGPPSWAEIDDT